VSNQARITGDAHRRLVRLAQETGKTQVEIIDMALSRLERELYMDRVNAGYMVLRENTRAWEAEEAERAEWDGVVADGLDDEE
jgi:hypothetical protein